MSRYRINCFVTKHDSGVMRLKDGDGWRGEGKEVVRGREFHVVISIVIEALMYSIRCAESIHGIHDRRNAINRKSCGESAIGR